MIIEPSFKKKVFIAASLILLAAGLGVGSWQYRRAQESKLRAATEEAARQQKRQAEESLQKEVSIGYAIITQAVKSKNPDDCLKLEKSVLDSCFYSVAQATSDKAVCERILDYNKRSACQEFLLFREMQDKLTKDFCGSLKSAQVSESCFSQIFSELGSTESCADFAEPHKQRCFDLVNTRLAITGDGGSCDAVKDKEIRSSCQVASASAPKDSDKDGLSDTTEISYGTDAFKKDSDGDGLNDNEEIERYLTNPTKADTDGDKHGDGEEVKGGFNPLGEGKLSK